jgi:hypothetical protein
MPKQKKWLIARNIDIDSKVKNKAKGFFFFFEREGL